MVDGMLLSVLELERVFERRYFSFENMYIRDNDRHRLDFLDKMHIALDILFLTAQPSFQPSMPQTVSLVTTAVPMGEETSSSTADTLTEFLARHLADLPLVACEHHIVEHHAAHATLGFYSSPFTTALVLSYDGIGSDGSTEIFVSRNAAALPKEQEGTKDYFLGLQYSHDGLTLQSDWRLVRYNIQYPMLYRLGENKNSVVERGIHRHTALAHVFSLKSSLGTAYSCIGKFLPEVTPAGTKFSLLSSPGKLMALAALGQYRKEWAYTVAQAWRNIEGAEVVRKCAITEGLMSTLRSVGFDVTSKRHRYDLAATAQNVFTAVVLELIRVLSNVFSMGRDGMPYGIVLTGGCALNVLANEAVRSRHQHVYVPSAPNDSGLSIGAALLLQGAEYEGELPRADFSLTRTQLQHVHLYGPHIWDLSELPDFVTDFGGVKVDIHKIAAILADDNIVGVVRGRTEVGPRALGHRSLLCYPANETLHAKLNLIKVRQWYRPVAPMMTVESLPAIVGVGSLDSRFMSFAPILTDQALKDFPVIAHFDGTARVQTVSRDDDEWLWELLRAVGVRRGSEILANTSFNSNGKPILNSAAAALQILHEEADLR
jgi:predicted NodU family carbamoyl transferase